MKKNRVHRIDGSVEVIIEVIQKKKRGDLDNHAKAVCDAMNGVVYTDDAVIDDLRIQRTIEPLERTVVTVRKINEQKRA